MISTRIAERILDLVLTIGNVARFSQEVTDAHVLDHENREFQIAKIEAFMTWGQPIHMVLPAFPAKSPNPKKTVSHRPDYGEVLALGRLDQLCTAISTMYEPGAEITICSDGRVFSDVVHVCDGAVDVYGRDIKAIIDENGYKNLKTFSLDDVFASHDYDRMRARLVSEFAESLESLRTRVQTDIETKYLFNGIHRFMYEDQLALNPAESKSKLKEKSKLLAYEVIRRSNAWSRLVEKEFPAAVRLSIHPQGPSSRKIGVRLMPSDDLWRTPWHSVTVFDGENYFLAPRAHVEAAGGVLKYAGDKYPYYVMTKPNNQEAVS